MPDSFSQRETIWPPLAGDVITRHQTKQAGDLFPQSVTDLGTREIVEWTTHIISAVIIPIIIQMAPVPGHGTAAARHSCWSSPCQQKLGRPTRPEPALLGSPQPEAQRVKRWVPSDPKRLLAALCPKRYAHIQSGFQILQNDLASLDCRL